MQCVPLVMLTSLLCRVARLALPLPAAPPLARTLFATPCLWHQVRAHIRVVACTPGW